MKKMATILLLMTIAISASAMSFTKARSQALFLTDKMGYELNLTDDQYNAVYEINLDYIMCINTQSDLFGIFWTRRDNELRFVLSGYQYQRYIALEYFYRPISWRSNSFYFHIYDRYEKKRYYRNAPTVYRTYKGGNRQYQHSPYQGRTYTNEPNRNIPSHKGTVAPPRMTKSQAIKGSRHQSSQNHGTIQYQNNGQKKNNMGGKR